MKRDQDFYLLGRRNMPNATRRTRHCTGANSSRETLKYHSLSDYELKQPALSVRKRKGRTRRETARFLKSSAGMSWAATRHPISVCVVQRLSDRPRDALCATCSHNLLDVRETVRGTRRVSGTSFVLIFSLLIAQPYSPQETI